jgi:acyl-CoA synthetase (NDP forming)
MAPRTSGTAQKAASRDVRFLDKFFGPEKVVIVGLSRSAIGAPVSVLTTLNDYGYAGEIYVINPNMTQADADNFNVCASLDELPDDIELAVVSVAREHVGNVLEGCAAKGIKGAIVITQGFADADEEGERLQEDMLTLVRDNGMRILGPNTIGIADAFACFTSSFIELENDRTAIGQVSQSGLFMMGHHLINNEPAGFCKSIDLGNASDIDLVDVLTYFGQSGDVDVIQCHVEGIVDGGAFVEAASRISKEKPIVLLKAGRSETGQAAVASHSGAAAGENEVYDAAFRKAGIVPASNPEELRLLSKAFVTYAPPKGKRVAVVSFSGGGAILAIDAIEGAGLEMAKLSKDTISDIEDLFPPWLTVGNPVDIWIPVAQDFDGSFPRILERVMQDDGVDAVICIYCSYTLPKYDALNSSKYIGKIGARYPDKPIMCWTYGLDIAGFSRKIEEQGTAMVFPSLEAAGTTIAKMADFETNRHLSVKETSSVFDVDDARVNSLLATARQAKSNYLFTESLEILEAYGINLAPWHFVNDESELARNAAEIGFPVCMKIVSADILHKSDSGGIRLNIEDERELIESYRGMCDDVLLYDPKATISGVILQAMAPKGKEVMIGAKQDPTFGPCVIVGTGGIYTEVLNDYTFRLAPLNEFEARKMLAELKLYPLLEGVRGEAPCEIDSIVDTVLRVSQLVSTHVAIKEIDINPLIVNEQGSIIVDARIIT